MLKVVSYNLHKGYSGRTRYVLPQIKTALEDLSPDLLCLQEVLGAHSKLTSPTKRHLPLEQFDFIAQDSWPHVAYGKNAEYRAGHHGNAILSKFKISDFFNHDISTNRLERRGFLHATVNLPEFPEALHCICVHLGLFGGARKRQIASIVQKLVESVPEHAPVIVAGDFNDWSLYATHHLERELQLKEAFKSFHGKHPRTFPSRFPLLHLDRIYFRNLTLVDASVPKGLPWNKLSDHMALVAHFSYK